MGILDKIMFWKKKDEFSEIGLGDKENLAFGNDFSAAPGTGLGPTPPGGQGYGQQYPQSQQSQGYPSSQPSMPSFSQPQFSQPQPSFNNPHQEMNSKNLEVISSKLDALRASIESLNQRLANLEAIARGEQEHSRRRGYY